MKILHSALVATAILACACNAKTPKPGKCTPYLRSLALKDPKTEADRVVRSGEIYLLAVRGFALSIPALDGGDSSTNLKYRIMEGTSDVIEDESCWLYQRRARQYAEKFNRRILDLAVKSGG